MIEQTVNITIDGNSTPKETLQQIETKVPQAVDAALQNQVLLEKVSKIHSLLSSAYKVSREILEIENSIDEKLYPENPENTLFRNDLLKLSLLCIRVKHPLYDSLIA